MASGPLHQKNMWLAPIQHSAPFWQYPAWSSLIEPLVDWWLLVLAARGNFFSGTVAAACENGGSAMSVAEACENEGPAVSMAGACENEE